MKFNLGLKKLFKKSNRKSSDLTDAITPPFSDNSQTSSVNGDQEIVFDPIKQMNRDFQEMATIPKKPHRPGLEELSDREAGLYESIRTNRASKPKTTSSNASDKENKPQLNSAQYEALADSSKTVVRNNTKKERSQQTQPSLLKKETVDAVKETFDMIKYNSRQGTRSSADIIGVELTKSQLTGYDRAWGDVTRKAANTLIERASGNEQLASQLNDIVSENSQSSRKQKIALIENKGFRTALSDTIRKDKRFDTDLSKKLFNTDVLNIEKSGEVHKFTDQVTRNGSPVRRPRAEKPTYDNVPSPYSEGQKELMRQVAYNGPGAQDQKDRQRNVMGLAKDGVDPRFVMPSGHTPKQFAIASGDKQMTMLLDVVEQDFENKDLQKRASNWTDKKGIGSFDTVPASGMVR